jgi:cobalt-zinc-cadmium efflux system outer membrane protein
MQQEFHMYRYERLLAFIGLFLVLTALPVIIFAQERPMEEGEFKETLSLHDALRRSKESPALKAVAINLDIQAGLADQAGLLPNPNFAIETENFGGKDALEDFDGAETTVSISQLIELGGKRSARKDIASHEKSLAEWDFLTQTQDLQLATMRAFYSVLAAQERLNQVSQLLDLATQGYQAVADRVEAGKVSPIQELRASVELNMARNSWEGSQRQLVQARQNLSSLWGASKPDFTVAIGEFDALKEPPAWENLRTAFLDTPEVKRWEAERANKNANLDLARANSIPDVTLSFGVRNYQETNDNAFVAGLEFPLPLFDRNQGGKKAAQAKVSQSHYQREAAIAQLESDLRSSYQELLATFHQASSIKLNIMPAAEKANEAAQIGYQEGKFDFLETLDAQRTLFDVKAQYIDAFSAYHDARLNVMRMTGRSDRLSTF